MLSAFILNPRDGVSDGMRDADSSIPLLRLPGGESVFGRQLRILCGCGIREFVVSAAPFPGRLEAEASPYEATGCKVTLVPGGGSGAGGTAGSLWNARRLLRGGGSWVFVRGDAVFDEGLACAAVESPLPSLVAVRATPARLSMLSSSPARGPSAAPHLRKAAGSMVPAGPVGETAALGGGVVARICSGEVHEISTGASGPDCVPYLPFWKLSEEAVETCLRAIRSFVDAGLGSADAEYAVNAVLPEMHVAPFPGAGHFHETVDGREDLGRVSDAVRRYDAAH